MVVKRGATIRVIAERAGVSRQTVSNALNFPQRLAPETLARVLQAIEELDYRPDELARSFMQRASRLIGFHVGDGSHNEASLLDPYMRELARIGLAAGYRIVLCYTEEDDDAQIRGYQDLAGRRAVDGFVITNTHAGDRRASWLTDHQIPFVAFGRPWGDPGARHNWVDVDGHLGVATAVRHLAERGHRRVAFLGPPPDGGIGDDRASGWRDVVLGLGLSPLPRLEAGEDYESVAACVRRAVLDSQVTAFVCRDDHYAAHALHSIGAAGFVPGRDVAVVGFDDSILARHARPRLSSLAQPLTRIAELTWHALLAQLARSVSASGAMGSERVPDGSQVSPAAPVEPTEPTQELVAPELIVRESSAATAPLF